MPSPPEGMRLDPGEARFPENVQVFIRHPALFPPRIKALKHFISLAANGDSHAGKHPSFGFDRAGEIGQDPGGVYRVAGVASLISDARGKSITRPHHFTDFCLKYCRSTAEGKRRCHISDRYGGAESPRSGKPRIYNCLNAGLMDCAAPIIVAGRHLATVLCGQVIDDPLDPDFGQKRALEIGVTDIDGYLQALETVPLMSRNRLLNIADLMAVITQTISELALRKYLQRKHSQHYLHKLINSVSDGIISTNVEGVIAMINKPGAVYHVHVDDAILRITYESHTRVGGGAAFCAVTHQRLRLRWVALSLHPSACPMFKMRIAGQESIGSFENSSGNAPPGVSDRSGRCRGFVPPLPQPFFVDRLPRSSQPPHPPQIRPRGEVNSPVRVTLNPLHLCFYHCGSFLLVLQGPLFRRSICSSGSYGFGCASISHDFSRCANPPDNLTLFEFGKKLREA
jgi:ligand-binding sensor protein